MRSLVYELLVDGLGASSTEIDFERRVPEVRGRIDALLEGPSLNSNPTSGVISVMPEGKLPDT